jgi:hypothetical protein
MAGIIEIDEIEKYHSPYGNRHVEISLAEVLELFKGKVFYTNDGEYSTFITLVSKHPWEE